MHGYQESFNPYRVFKFVATSTTKHGLMQKYPVSIPIGFSSSLQLQFEIDNALYVVLFQSLSGFQVRCNGTNGTGTGTGTNGFNPYRVFKFVATYGTEITKTAEQWFQSLSGFQVRCNATVRMIRNGQVSSFNPYRVFKFVATKFMPCPRRR